MNLENKRIGFIMTGSFCTFRKTIEELKKIVKLNATVIPIMSQNSYTMDTKFGNAEDFIKEVEEITGNRILHTIQEVEPIGPKDMLDILVVAPASGNTIAKLANDIIDGPATMAVKSHLRRERPVVIAISTNNGLSGAGENIGKLLNRKNYYFVDDGKLEEFRKNGNLIEERAYHTVYGIWTYFTADDGQVNLADSDYLGIGTLESFKKMRKYYGEDAVCPVYVQVEDGERLSRALNREREQENPRYEEMCRRFIADQSDFSEENILNAGIEKRFQNINLDDCVKEIANYIKSVQ